MARLMGLFADRLTPNSNVARTLFNWPGDPAIQKDNAPLRLAGALHALKLEALALGEVYPPQSVSDDDLWDAVSYSLEKHEERILDWLTRPPQTNEVRRAAALLPALALIEERYRLPVELLELGCSAGLNLRADHFGLTVPNGTIGLVDAKVLLEPEWRGEAPVQHRLPHIVRRAGVDLSPLDPSDAKDQLRLLAYLWADQPDRLKRTKAAIEIAQSWPVEIAAEDAGTWLSRQLARPSDGILRVVFHTVAWQYFPKETQLQLENAIAAHDGPIARFSMEADGGRGAALTLRHGSTAKAISLGRSDFHGRWVDWHPES
jgi:hypothetical protein